MHEVKMPHDTSWTDRWPEGVRGLFRANAERHGSVSHEMCGDCGAWILNFDWSTHMPYTPIRCADCHATAALREQACPVCVLGGHGVLCDRHAADAVECYRQACEEGQ